MKNILLILMVLISIKVTHAQVPNQFNYQAVARNSQGQSIPNANIRTRFTILDGSATGTNVYSEVRLLTTNQLGLFTAAIGGIGATNITGNFATIDWSTGKKFIKVEVDPLGGTNFLALGSTEMLSVPYALYAVNGKVGPAGPPNVLNVGNVVTGATGTPASATITGTSPSQTINLVLPTGANGKISLVKTTAEVAGVNCAVGGTKIEAGIDNNGNNTLDAAEVTNISYVCNGDVNNTWKTTGNAGTTAANFIGTTDNNPFTIKTNNADAIKILPNGNVGIGTNTPTKGKLEISNATGGNTVAAFGTDGTGISIQRNWPTIGFNQYRDNSNVARYMGNGKASWLYYEPTGGSFGWDVYDATGTADHAITTIGTRALTILNNGNIGIRSGGGAASLVVERQGNISGSAMLGGTTHHSYFASNAQEDTYIRGGINNSKVIINDIPGSKILSYGNTATGLYPSNNHSPLIASEIWGAMAFENVQRLTISATCCTLIDPKVSSYFILTGAVPNAYSTMKPNTPYVDGQIVVIECIGTNSVHFAGGPGSHVYRDFLLGGGDVLTLIYNKDRVIAGISGIWMPLAFTDN